MIELTFHGTGTTYPNDTVALFNMMNILAWMMSSIKQLEEQNEEQREAIIHGILIGKNEDRGYEALLVTNPTTETTILRILNEPPEEFKGKYIACILSSEPEPVLENKESIDDDKESKKEET